MDSNIIKKVAHRLNDTFNQDIIDSLNILGLVGTEEEVIAVLQELLEKNNCQKRKLLLAFADYSDYRNDQSQYIARYMIDEFLIDYQSND